jgi:radical SAM protein with 4Fe4S-binding SPASM domain
MCVVTFDWEENDAKKKFENFKTRDGLTWAVVEVTEACNFNCKWCFANAGENRRPVQMKKERAFELIEKLSQAGVRQITLSGGEPTVYPHLKEVIRKAREHDMVVHMNTNGFLLTKGLARELKECGLSQVQINIDSLHPQEHDYIRGKVGSHGRAIRALKNAKEAGLTSVSQTVLTKKNEDQIVDIFRFARGMGIQRCRVWDMTPSDGCAKENAELLPTDYMATLQELADLAIETGGQAIEAGEPLFRRHIDTDLPVTGGFCVAAMGMYCTVSSRGDVYFCATLREPLYNAYNEDDIGRVHKERAADYITSFGDCGGCHQVLECNGGCYTRRRYTGADYWCRTSDLSVRQNHELATA